MTKDGDSIAKNAALAADLAGVAETPFPALQALRTEEHGWQNIAPRYGVTQTDPPWKVSLYATLECLSLNETLPSLQRRHIEDHLGEKIYRDTAGADQQLVSLAHILLSRNVLNEQELSERLRAVRTRLEAE